MTGSDIPRAGDYARTRNLARDHILRVLADDKWHTTAELTDCEDDEMRSACRGILKLLCKDGRLVRRSFVSNGTQSSEYRRATDTVIPEPPADAAFEESYGAHPACIPRTSTRDEILALLSDGVWRTYAEIATSLNYNPRVISGIVRRLRSKGVVIARAAPLESFAFLEFSLAEVVE